MKLKLFLFAVLLISIHSCKKEDEDLGIPSITYISISHSEVIEFSEEVSITISYEDSKGDLGQTDPDNLSLKIKDSRLDDSDWYHIPPITPNGQELITYGEFTISLGSLFILGNGSEEPATFSVQIKDRMGQWSNTITTPSVLIIEE